MAKAGDFSDILIRARIISQEQVAEAKKIAKSQNKKLADALIDLGYATGEEVIRAMAKEHGLDYVNLKEVVIPPAVVTPDGVWHDITDLGWIPMVAWGARKDKGETAEAERLWPPIVRGIFEKHRDCITVGLDVHS